MALNERNSHYLTEIQRAAIYGAWKTNKLSFQEVADLFKDLNITAGCVCKIVQKYKEQGNFQDKPRPGRPSYWTDDEQRLLKEVLQQPKGTIK